ncbi:O-antigen ligase family protein [Candidatus Fermentibacteria bacterium]|nr:O-antigen ligase family protein [Candidatus Fermentibacteria bacterium]
MTAVAAVALGAWIASMLPAMLGAPWHITMAIWAVFLIVALAATARDRALFLPLTYVALVAFPVVDYLLPPRHGFIGGAPGNLAYYPADLLLLAAAALAAIHGQPILPRGPLKGFLLLGGAYLVGLLPGALVSTHPLESWMQWLATVRAILAATVVAGLSLRGAGQAIPVLLGVVIVQAGLAAAQQIRQGALGLMLLGEAGDDQLFKYIAQGVGLWRSGGTIGHPNSFASYVVGLLPVCVITAVAGRPAAFRILGLVSAVASVASLVWSYSRAAWAVALISLAVLAALAMRAFSRRRAISRRVIAMSVVAGVVVVLSLPAVRHRLQRTETSAADVRVALVSVARSMLRAYPISGVGLSQFAVRVPEFDPVLALELFRHPVHSIVMLDAAEAGYPGGFASVAMWGGGAVLAFCHAYACARRRRLQAAGMWVGCVALVLHNALDWTLRQPAILLLFWVLVALASSEEIAEREPVYPQGGAPEDGRL